MNKNFLLLLLCVAATLPATAQNKIEDRVSESAQVLSQILSRPDAIPQALLDKSVCVLVFPAVKKVGVGIGVTYGRGVIACRSGYRYERSMVRPSDVQTGRR
jgi:lipid-binding SYLF domain-containing protein